MARGARILLAAALVAVLVLPWGAGFASAAPTPTFVRVSGAPTWAFEGTYVTVTWEVKLNASTPPAAIGDSALYLDNVSHAADSYVYWVYKTRVGASTTDGRNFVATFLAPSAPARLYLMVIANISGTTFYNATERVLDVYEQPVVRLATPGLIAAGESGTVRLEVDWDGPLSVSLASLHYDTQSHAAVRNLTAYPNATVPQGGAARAYDIPLVAPAIEGDLYLIGRARIGGVDFYTAVEYRIAVSTGPRVENLVISPASGLAIAGQTMTLAFDINFDSAGQPVTSVFRFATASHAAEGLNASLYPGASTSTTAVPGTRFTVTFVAPAEAGTAYGIVSVLVGLRAYVASQELAIPVLARPTLTVESVSESVNAAQPITVVWRIVFSGNSSLITDSSVRWDTASHAVSTPTLTIYPNAVGHFDGNSTNVFTASIPPLGSEGKVYFTVSARVNGVDVFLPTEKAVAVAKSPAGFLPGFDLGAVAAALAAAAVVCAARRRLPE